MLSSTLDSYFAPEVLSALQAIFNDWQEIIAQLACALTATEAEVQLRNDSVTRLGQLHRRVGWFRQSQASPRIVGVEIPELPPRRQ